MRASLLSLLLLLASPLSRAVPSAAQDVFYSAAQEGVLRSSPGGSHSGTVRAGVPLKKLEVRGDWVRLSAEGWMRLTDVTPQKTQVTQNAPASATAPGQGGISLSDFEIEDISKNVSGDRPRVKLKLALKNETDRIVRNWSALLVIQSPTGEVFVRTGITNGPDPINPQSVGEATYYWTDNEEAYGTLSGRKKADLKVSLFQVKVE